MVEYPVTNGVTTFISPPDGYKVNFDNPKSQKVLDHYVIFGFGATLAIFTLVQRFYTKIFLYHGLAIDDALMVLAWLSSLLMQISQIYSISVGGLCHHAWEMPLSTYQTHMITTYIAAVAFLLCNGFAKISLLTFYRQLSPQIWFRRCIHTAIAVIALYITIISFFLLFTCRPPSVQFDPYVTGKCMNSGVLYMATAVSNIASDVILFVVPLPMVLRLKMGKAQKIGAVLMFSIGSLTVTTSIVRLVYLPKLLSTDDVPWVAAPANVWSILEVNLLIICGSMLTLRKFFLHVAPRMFSSPCASKSTRVSQPHISTSGIVTIGAKRSRQPQSQHEQFEEVELPRFPGNSMGGNEALLISGGNGYGAP